MRLMISGMSRMIREILIISILIGSACAINDYQISLVTCTDPNAIMDLQQLLNSYHYTQKYNTDSFNCVEFTTACIQFLDKNGYNTAAMIHTYGKNESEGHCYPVVEIKNKGWIAIEPCYSRISDITLGIVVKSGSGKYNYLNGYFLNNTTELNEFDAGSDPIYTGDLTRFIVKN